MFVLSVSLSYKTTPSIVVSAIDAPINLTITALGSIIALVATTIDYSSRLSHF